MSGKKKCDSCYKVLEISLFHRTGYCFECVCPEKINSYYYKPNPNFLGTGKYHFGLELEVVYDKITPYKEFHDTIEELDNLLNDFAYLKHDSSISTVREKNGLYRGVEIVTQPIGTDNISEYLKRLGVVKELGFKTDYTNCSCGFHIHVCRDKLRNKQLINLLKFLYKKENKEFLYNISGRKRNNFDRWCNNEWVMGDSIENVVETEEIIRRGIVGLKDKTLELRLFNGTVEYEILEEKVKIFEKMLEMSKKEEITNTEELLNF